LARRNSWRTVGINAAGINDTNLRPLPSRQTDSFATFHKVSASKMDNGISNASFVDEASTKSILGLDGRGRGTLLARPKPAPDLLAVPDQGGWTGASPPGKDRRQQ
jgi:hypothetical protein